MEATTADKLDILLFQHKIYDLELGCFEVLESEDFCARLKNYLSRLFALGKRDIVTKVLTQVGHCAAGHQKQCLRVRSIEIVTDFAKLLSGHKDRDFFQLIANILTGWLKAEKQPHSLHSRLFGEILTIVKRMFSLQLYPQTEPLVTVSKKISHGEVVAEKLVKERVSRLHRNIADEKAIESIVQYFLEKRDPGSSGISDLLVSLTPHSTEAMIHSLFRCSKKNTRLALLDMISKESEGVLPILIEKLKDRQPWYVVRNSMILLGALGDPDLYNFAHPFLDYPDKRVQREVVLCIVALGGENVPKRLIASFARVNDEVKPTILEQLQVYSGHDIDALFLDVLEQRIHFKPEIREILIQKICSSGKLRSNETIVELLNSMISERKLSISGNNAL